MNELPKDESVPGDAETIRRAVMLSMAVTGERYTTADGSALYSHDDYDEAHAALNRLVIENHRLREALKEIATRYFATSTAGPDGQNLCRIVQTARDALDAPEAT